ncbi:MAG: hypothetical protein V3S98_10610 [Dehalococcoidia bacterium]
MAHTETTSLAGLGTRITAKLSDADKRRGEGLDSWLEAAIQSDAHFKGEFMHSAHSGQPITKNKQYAATRTIHAAVTPKEIRIEVVPIRALDTMAASLMEDILNWNTHVTGLKETVDYIELDGQVKGVGISYVTWRAGATPEPKPGENEQDDAALTDKKGEPDEGLWDALEANMPHRLNGGHLARVFHIDPYDFLIDPLATKMEDARWAAHRVWLTKEEIFDMQKRGFLDAKHEDIVYLQTLESADRFSRVKRERGDEDHPATQLSDGGDADPQSNEKIWELWQFHDFKTKEVTYVIPGMDKPARSSRPNPLGNPYQDYRPNRTGDAFWSKPDSWIYAPAQLKLDQAMDSIAYLVNVMAKPARLFDKEAGDDADIVNLTGIQPGQWLGVKADLLNSIKPINDNFNIPDAFGELIGRLEDVITETSAVSEIASGSLGAAGVTATAANLSAGSQSLRSGYNRRVLTAWLNEVIRRMAFVIQTFFTQSDALPVLGSRASQWQKPEEPGGRNPRINDQLQGQMNFKVHAGDEADEVTVEQRKMSMDLLQIIVPMVASGQIQVDMVRLLQYVLELNDYPADLIPAQQTPQATPNLGGQPDPGQPAPVSGGPNSGRPTGSTGVPNPDGLSRDRAPAAAAIRSGAGQVR